MKLNQNYNNLEENYLFAEIAGRVQRFSKENPGKDIIRLGIGDVTLPICSAVTKAMHKAVDEMACRESFKGYGPYEGYGFLREAIKGYYAGMGVSLETREIFVSDGAKSDVANILDIFDTDNTVLIPDPVYPVYLDTNVMDGRKVIYMDANEQNGFLPLPDGSVQADVIYLCSPNNPTGAVYSREGLKAWVDYAKKQGAVILFDAAYEAFIQDKALPRSIYDIDGARECAVELCSLSKTAGFTGTRCGYTVVPKELSRGGVSLAERWLRRQATKFNGVSYVVQAGAKAVFSEEGLAEIRSNIAYYMRNAEVIAKMCEDLRLWYTGGKNSPYIWLKCPDNMKSWEFFDLLLHKANVVGTPGAGFGRNGEGFFRLTAFGDNEATAQAAGRIKALLGQR